MSRQAAEDGFTLIEVLVAMIVLGIGVTALLVAFGTHAKTTFANRNQALAESTLASAAEYVKSYTWQPTLSGGTCALIPHADLDANKPTPPSGFTVTFSDGVSIPSASTCELQRVTVDVAGFSYDMTVDIAVRAAVEVTP